MDDIINETVDGQKRRDLAQRAMHSDLLDDLGWQAQQMSPDALSR